MKFHIDEDGEVVAVDAEGSVLEYFGHISGVTKPVLVTSRSQDAIRAWWASWRPKGQRASAVAPERHVSEPNENTTLIGQLLAAELQESASEVYREMVA